MGFESTRIGVIDAQKVADYTWELILNNWGNHGVDGCTFANPPPPTLVCADPLALVYPGVIKNESMPTVSGLAIAPRSDADRVVVSYRVNALDPRERDIVEELVHDQGHMAIHDQLISVDRAWFGNLNGPLIIRASGDEWFGDEYFPADGAGVAAPFGTVMTNPDIPFGIFEAPTLRLLLFLQGSPPPPSPFRRSPYHFASILDPQFTVAGAAAKTIVKVLPVMGRRNIAIMMRGATVGGGSTVKVTVGGVNAGVDTRLQISQGTIEPATEVILMSEQTLAIGGTFRVTLSEPQVQYLTIYVERTGVGSEGGVYVTVDAND